MPTFDTTARFDKDYAALSADAKARFREAVRKYVEDLRRDGLPRAALGIRSMRKRPGVFEFHFDGNGRATFEYGNEIVPGEVHIVWRRIGTHDIYDAP